MTAILRIFFSSPSDCDSYYKIAQEAVSEFNENLGETYPIRYEIFNYKDKCLSDFNSCSAQEIVNKTLFNKGNANFEYYLGVMKHRLGMATEKYESGTVEEFNLALEVAQKESKSALKIAFLFFSGPMSKRSRSQDYKQKAAVEEFKEKIGKQGLYKNFSKNADFKKEVNKLLSGWARNYDNSTPSLNKITAEPEFEISPSFLSSIESIDPLLWRDTLANKLQDTWIPPCFNWARIKSKGDVNEEPINFENLLIKSKDGISSVILGSSESGKTALSRMLFLELSKHSTYIPVLVNLDNRIRPSDSSNPAARIQHLLVTEYDQINQKEARDIDPKKIIIILDDFLSSKINKKDQTNILKILRETYRSVILLAKNEDEFCFPTKEFIETSLSKTIHLKISRPGSALTDQIVQKWYNLSPTAGTNQAIHGFQRVQLVLGTGVIECNYWAIVSILRTTEFTTNTNKIERGYTLYYGTLVDGYLARHLEPESLETARNLLERLAWEQFRSENEKALTCSTVDTILSEWSSTHGLNKDTLVDCYTSLIAESILEKKEDGIILFARPYVYCYYAAQSLFHYITQENQEAISLFENLQEGAWTHNTAMILSFFASLERGGKAASLVSARLKKSFTATPEISVSDLSLNVWGASDNMPQLNFDMSKSTTKRRQEVFSKDDAISVDEDKDPSLVLNEVEELFASIRVMGNLMRENYTTLRLEQKQEMVNISISALLRLLYSCLSPLSAEYKKLKNEISFISNSVEKNQKGEILKIMHRFVELILAGGVSITAQLLGDKNITTEHFYLPFSDDNILHNLCILGCELEHMDTNNENDNSKFPIQKLVSLSDRKSYIIFSALRLLVFRSLQLRPPKKYASMQTICKLLNISPQNIEKSRIAMQEH